MNFNKFYFIKILQFVIFHNVSFLKNRNWKTKMLYKNMYFMWINGKILKVHTQWWPFCILKYRFCPFKKSVYMSILLVIHKTGIQTIKLYKFMITKKSLKFCFLVRRSKVNFMMRDKKNGSYFFSWNNPLEDTLRLQVFILRRRSEWGWGGGAV